VSDLPPPSYRDLLAENAALRAMVAELTARLEQAMRQIADLEGRLKLSSANSSKPPSSDGLAKPAPKSLRPRSGRGPGQGHCVFGGRRLELGLCRVIDLSGGARGG
jgi:transposase